MNTMDFKRAALFDLDGVLVDTEPQYTAFWEEIGREFFPTDPDFAESLKGHTLTHIYNTHFADSAAARELVRQRLEDFEAQMHYPLLAGSMEYVKALREKGWGLAVVTSSDRVKMECFYRSHPDFPQLFHRIFTAEDVKRSKPAPDGYVEAAHFFGLEPQECVVFEDSLNGLRAGRDSGAKLVGFTTSLPAEEIAPMCDVVVSDYESLSQLNIEELWQDI
ncbi:MAG: HAD family phosphatase [Bacteroidaceae bacterium]|nr:HAD family phosphatase [Bacteroidaceae bacterium]